MAPLMTKSETPAPITIFLTEPLSYPSHMTFSFNSKMSQSSKFHDKVYAYLQMSTKFVHIP
jgi:hypothetical protein